MPFRTFTTPYTGDDDLPDFMNDVWLAFVTDTGPSGGMAWIEEAPARGAHPTFEFWVHKGTVGSPLAPFGFYRTQANDHMHIFTGNGVDLAQELFDQPDNPMNCPADAGFSLGVIPEWTADTRCPIMNDVAGVHQKVWLFGDTDASYVHAVIKVSVRQYRHFHIGLLKRLHSDMDAGSFYITGHFHEQLDPTALTSVLISGSPPANAEHDPYSTLHALPFSQRFVGNEADGGARTRMQAAGNWLYMPGMNIGKGISGSNIDWYKTFGGDEISWQSETGDAIRKEIGDVNNANDAVTFGCAQISGYGDGLGAILFAADRTFTSNAVPLVPIYISAGFDFSGDIRQGVVAQIPDVFRINMKNIGAEEEITVGSDTYVCFPMINKDSATVLAGEGYSGFEGLAYRKITANIT